MEISLSKYLKSKGFKGTQHYANLEGVHKRTLARWWNNDFDRENVLKPRIEQYIKSRQS